MTILPHRRTALIFDESALAGWAARLTPPPARSGARAMPERGRQPVHTVYESAHLFTPDRARVLGDVALDSVERFGPDPATFARAVGMEAGSISEVVHHRVIEKLESDAVEDLRLDFEDGYRGGGDSVEDGDAIAAGERIAAAMADGTLPAGIGVRIRSLGDGLHRRSLRTLELVLSTLVERAGAVPVGFRVTLPKITAAEQVAVLAEALDRLEARLAVDDPIPVELMVETPQLVIDEDGRVGLRHHVEAGGGRVLAAHLGAYDYTTALDIAAAHQGLANPVAEFARQVMKAALAGTGVWLSDGSTNVMPVGDRDTVWSAWQTQFVEVRRAMRAGFYQGWDLHGGQLPSRYAAVYSFFAETIDDATARLASLADAGTTMGEVYDDPATGESLLRFVRRAADCGAVDADQAAADAGLSPVEMSGGTFQEILDARR